MTAFDSVNSSYMDFVSGDAKQIGKLTTQMNGSKKVASELSVAEFLYGNVFEGCDVPQLILCIRAPVKDSFIPGECITTMCLQQITFAYVSISRRIRYNIVPN